MKIKFKKDTTTNSRIYGAILEKGNDGVFVCWFDMDELKKGETRNDYVNRMIKEAGYDSLEDFFNHNLKEEK